MTKTAYYTDRTGRTCCDADNNSILDYSFKWTDWLADVQDSVSSYLFTLDAGLTKESDSNVDGVISAKINTNGLSGEFKVSCRITTVAGRVDERTFYLISKER